MSGLRSKKRSRVLDPGRNLQSSFFNEPQIDSEFSEYLNAQKKSFKTISQRKQTLFEGKDPHQVGLAEQYITREEALYPNSAWLLRDANASLANELSFFNQANKGSIFGLLDALENEKEASIELRTRKDFDRVAARANAGIQGVKPLTSYRRDARQGAINDMRNPPSFSFSRPQTPRGRERNRTLERNRPSRGRRAQSQKRPAGTPRAPSLISPARSRSNSQTNFEFKREK